MLIEYRNDLLDDYLNQIAHPVLKDKLTYSFKLIASHYNDTVKLDAFIKSSLEPIQEGRIEITGSLELFMKDVIEFICKCIAEYRIIINSNEQIPSNLDKLNAILFTLVEVDEFEDTKALNEIIELGNSEKERFGEIVHLLVPTIEVDDIMGIIELVLPTFFDMLKTVIDASLRYQRNGENEFELQRKRNIDKIKTLYPNANTSVILSAMAEHNDGEALSWVTSFFETHSEEIESVETYLDTVKGIYYYLVSITGMKLSKNSFIEYIPSIGHLDDMMEQMKFTQSFLNSEV